MKALAQGFGPVVGAGARCLVLGSLPGRASLAAQAYYAHPRNVFWRIMGDLFAAGPQWPYAERLARLKAAGVALWDVIAACERPGSLDADIVPGSVRVNDFASFFAVHRGIGWVFFNGGAAATAFRRLVSPGLALPEVVLLRLPSTSPAHASQDYAAKLAAWSVLQAACGHGAAGAQMGSGASFGKMQG